MLLSFGFPKGLSVKCVIWIGENTHAISAYITVIHENSDFFYSHISITLTEILPSYMYSFWQSKVLEKYDLKVHFKHVSACTVDATRVGSALHEYLHM